MKFVCLGYLAPNKLETFTEDARNGMMDECFIYDDVLREGGHFAVAEALQPAKTAKTLRYKNGKVAGHRRPLRRNQGIHWRSPRPRGARFRSRHRVDIETSRSKVRPVGDPSGRRPERHGPRKRATAGKGQVKINLRVPHPSFRCSGGIPPSRRLRAIQDDSIHRTMRAHVSDWQTGTNTKIDPMVSNPPQPNAG